MNRIIDHLYVGGAEDACDKDQLIANNIQCIINVACEVPCNEKLNTALGISYYRYLWDDDRSYNIFDQLKHVVEDIHLNRLQKKNVLVHCHLGRSRAVSAVIAYLIWYMDQSYYSAYTIVRSKRIIARPNSSFKRQLVEFWHGKKRDLLNQSSKRAMVLKELIDLKSN